MHVIVVCDNGVLGIGGMYPSKGEAEEMVAIWRKHGCRECASWSYLVMPVQSLVDLHP